LIDSTFLDNAADALVAAVERCEQIDGRALVVTNGQPRPIAELIGRIVAAAGLDPPTRHVPAWLATSGGHVIDRIWARTGRTGDPPMTGFVAEQMSTAHWFDQREARRLLAWEPTVSLDEGFSRLRSWFALPIAARSS
jgi:nucleoside-diphosphate-sugar epimerase